MAAPDSVLLREDFELSMIEAHFIARKARLLAAKLLQFRTRTP
jgi:hypothetical protein